MDTPTGGRWGLESVNGVGLLVRCRKDDWPQVASVYIDPSEPDFQFQLLQH